LLSQPLGVGLPHFFNPTWATHFQWSHCYAGSGIACES
jgi:hypothetical protein